MVAESESPAKVSTEVAAAPRHSQTDKERRRPRPMGRAKLSSLNLTRQTDRSRPPKLNSLTVLSGSLGILAHAGSDSPIRRNRMRMGNEQRARAPQKNIRMQSRRREATAGYRRRKNARRRRSTKKYETSGHRKGRRRTAETKRYAPLLRNTESHRTLCNGRTTRGAPTRRQIPKKNAIREV